MVFVFYSVALILLTIVASTWQVFSTRARARAAAAASKQEHGRCLGRADGISSRAANLRDIFQKRKYQESNLAENLADKALASMQRIRAESPDHSLLTEKLRLEMIEIGIERLERSLVATEECV